MDVTLLLPLIARFRAVMLALGQAVASRNSVRLDASLGHWAAMGVVRRDVLAFAFQRIARARLLLEGVVARMQAGTLRVGRRGPLAVARVGVSRPVLEFAVVTRRFAWLCPLVQSEAACQAQYLRQILATPEMQALLAEVPQAARILKPVLHMLGIRLERVLREVLPAVVEPEGVAASGVSSFWAYEHGAFQRFVAGPAAIVENG